MIKIGLNSVSVGNRCYLGHTLVFEKSPIPTNGLLVDLNADTMFTTGDVLATDGQVITNWGNAISGSGIAGATQDVSGSRPILQIESGVKAVKFDGTNDFLNFNNTDDSKLHWDKSESHCIIVMLGNDITSGRIIHRGYSNYKAEYSMFFSGTDYSNFVYSSDSPQQFWVDSPITVPAPTFLAINYRGADATFDGWINSLKVFDDLAVAGSADNTSHPTLIGARTNTVSTSFGNFFGGSIRRILIYDRALTDIEIANLNTELL